jgi:acyl dehydratase
MIEFPDLASLTARVGQEIGVSAWIEITQDRINQFADATDDHQWIHVDAARAAVESPSKATIAHGFLTLSLLPVMLRRTIKLPAMRMSINYGTNKVRFITPLPVGSEIRGRFSLAAVKDTDDSGVQVIWNVTIERNGSEKPCAVVEWIARYYSNL